MISDMNVDILWAKPFKSKEKDEFVSQFVLITLNKIALMRN